MVAGSRAGVGLLCQQKSQCGGEEARAMPASATILLAALGWGWAPALEGCRCRDAHSQSVVLRFGLLVRAGCVSFSCVPQCGGTWGWGTGQTGAL